MNAARNLIVLSDKTTSIFCRELDRSLRAAELPCRIVDAGYDAWQREIFEPRSSTLSDSTATLAFVLSPRLVERDDLAGVLDVLLQRLAHLQPLRTVLFSNFVADPQVVSPLLRQRELSSIVAALNQQLLEFAASHNWFHIVDHAGLCTLEGLRSLTDARFEASAQMYFSPAGQKALARLWYRSVSALWHVPKKVLVADLDNTLWHGVVGEDGFDGIEMGSTEKGWPHRRLQQALLDLKSRGILLAVASKNNPDEAMRVLAEHPQCLLRPADFACLEISWDTKSAALTRIARSLNLGCDALVFLDDSAFEREEVRRTLPEVTVLDFPATPIGLATVLGETTAFDTLSFTTEDQQRAASYQAEAERAQIRAQATSAEDFYRSLQLRLAIMDAGLDQLARVHQLVGKTNQFNLTTERLTLEQVRARLGVAHWQTFVLRVADKMGDSGLTGVAFVNTVDQSHWIVENFLLSCRVIGRTIENAFVAWLAERAAAAGAARLSFRFAASDRNEVARQFLEQSGLVASADRKLWSLVADGGATILAPSFVAVEYQHGND